MVAFFVAGTPAPQGSKRFLGVHGGKGVLAESASEAVRSWRADVRAAAAPLFPAVLAGAVRVEVEFRLARPKSVSVRARPRPTARPDLDKLVRSTLDALKSAGAYGDDSQVVELRAVKAYATAGQPAGAVIGVSSV